MGSSLGFLLSLFFSVQVVAYVGDLVSLQYVYSILEGVATTVGHMITVEGYISPKAESYAKEKAYAFIEPLSKASKVGEIYEFAVFKEYKPIIISSSIIRLSVERSVMIGYIE